MKTTEPKQPEIKATSFCVVCGTPVRMVPSTNSLDGEDGPPRYEYVPTMPYSKLIAAIKNLLQCRIDAIEADGDNPDNWVEVTMAREVLKECNAL